MVDEIRDSKGYVSVEREIWDDDEEIGWQEWDRNEKRMLAKLPELTITYEISQKSEEVGTSKSGPNSWEELGTAEMLSNRDVENPNGGIFRAKQYFNVN